MAARAAAILLTMALLVSLSSCQQFFTASLAGYLARDSYAIPSDLPVGDAIDLLDTAKASGDEQLAAALVTPLYNAASAATPGTAAYDEAATALTQAVLLSSGVGTAIGDIVTDLGTADLGSITPDQIDAALTSVATISLTTAETTALRMIAADPPASLGTDDAYIAALSIAVDAFGDAGVALSSLTDFSDLINTGTLPTGVDSASINAAIDLLTYAQTLDAADGTDSLLGQMLSGVNFN
jgi:hypothetical protein